MDFTLNEQQQQLRHMAHQVAETVLRPVALEADRTGVIPEETLRTLQQIDRMRAAQGSAAHKEKPAGGNGQTKESFSNRNSLIGAEEFAWGDAGVTLSRPGPGLGGPPVRITGTPEQQERFLGPFEDDELRWGAYALTEPGAGSDAANIVATARKDGDNYVINGTKCFITNGARADWNVVFATIDKSLGRAGQRAFVVPNDTPGFRVGKIEVKMGLKASETAELVYEDCVVSVDNLLGGEEHYERKAKGGFKTAMATFDATRPLVAIMAVGIARASYERVREFLQDTYMLDRPLPRYQLLKTRLADMYRKIETGRLLCWRAAWMADHGLPNSKEASMSKAYCGQAATEVCADAVRLMQAHGLMHDQWVEKWFRDIKVFDIFEGTGEVQRIVVSRRMLQ